MKFLGLLAAATAAVSIAGAAHAGNLILAGDSTIAFRQNSGIAGNVAFAQNLVAGGSSVRIFGGPGAPAYTPQLVSAFGSLPGVTASNFSTAITSEQLMGADVFIAFFPNRAFTLDEAGVVSSFLSAGGTVFLAGESQNNLFGNPLGALQNARLNLLLEAIGSTMRLEASTLDPFDQFATLGDNEIVVDPLTAGVDRFGYGLTTSVAGGQPLFLTNDLIPFVSVERFDAGVVPEPATWALMIAGFGLVGGAIRRRSAQAA